MRFQYGDREFVLEEGDCVYFDSSIPHTGEPVDDEELKCLMVIIHQLCEDLPISSISGKEL